jgi:hypothetical protein
MALTGPTYPRGSVTKFAKDVVAGDWVQRGSIYGRVVAAEEGFLGHDGIAFLIHEAQTIWHVWHFTFDPLAQFTVLPIDPDADPVEVPRPEA